MPLYEFLRLARGKLESAEQKTAPPTDVSSAPENDVVELVWDNGQIMTQGQSNRAKKSPDLNDFPSQTSGFRERYTEISTPKVGRFGAIESTLNYALPSVPSGELYLNQEDEMGPWLNYSGDSGFRSDFYSENLPEISGVTGNDPSSLNSFASMGKGSLNQMLQLSHTVPVLNGVDSEVRNAAKISSSRTSSLGPYSAQQYQISVPSAGSGVLSIDVNTACNNPDALFGDSVQGQASLGSFFGMKMPKEKLGLPGTASSVLNFSLFSRPAAPFKSDIQKTDCLAASCSSGTEKMGVEKVSGTNSNAPIEPSQVKPCSNSRKDFCFHNQPKLVSAKVDSRPSVVKPPEELSSAQQSDALLQEDSIKYDKSLSPVIGPSTTKQVKDGENSVEAVLAASSVCSGNSCDEASNDQMHKLKRKNHDNEESESRSEDIEEESVPIKKAANARRGSGSKRSRAAEVHNLSERRRRDRINEKMRALQELIPNCNKADKASMLDEAIEYLKTLQLQVQMMSMGAGLCIPPMMFPTGLQHMHTALVPHFPPMGAGMGMGMGFRMGMLDMNSVSPRFPVFPVPPMQGAHFHSPPISGPSTFQGFAGSSLQVFGLPSQGVPISIPRVPLVPLVGQAPISSAVGSNASRMGFHVEAPNISPNFNSDVAVQDKNSQLVNNNDTRCSRNQTSNQLQATNKDINQSARTSKDDQAPDVCGAAFANLASTTDVVSNKEVGSH